MRDLDPDRSARGVSGGAELPAHASPTYYDRPLLKKPHWEWEVVVYLFMGGVMGGSGILVALADEDGEDAALARNARYLAFVLASTCPLVLIKHLGRPERFLHMLRIFKLKSVMSMGVWGLIGFSLPAGASAAAQLARDGVLPERLRFVRFFGPRSLTNPMQLVLGAFIGGYTGVLLSATANPLWATGKRHIPMLSVSSGIAGACAANNALLALFGGNESTSRKLDILEAVAGLGELVVLLSFRHHAGVVGKPMFAAARGTRLRNATMLGGIVVPALLNLVPLHARAKTLVASALTLAGGYMLRETLIEAGKESADDPRVSSRQPE
ncbi:MAG: polysulfide reductase NrfD [Candidatus Eremiobacteraeota bacterium]|nr:polysulfide reductase NrfD [Candidatus Eremiobacteraeota bacterium]